MAHVETFDDFNSTNNLGNYKDQPPFAFREDKTEEGTHNWLITNFEQLERTSQSRMRTYRRYIALYKGIHWRDYDSRDVRRDSDYTDRKPRHAVNFVHEFIEQKVAQISRLGINVTLIPNNSGEQSDINNAKGCKMLLDARAYEDDLKAKFAMAHRVTTNLGHVFMKVTWDESKGPLHPDYKEAQKANRQIDMFDGDKKVGKFKGEIHIGDTDNSVCGPDRLFPELNKECWADVNHVDWTEWLPLEQVQADYPNKKNKINVNDRMMYNYGTSEMTQPKDTVLVRHFWHKPTKYLPEGAYIKYVEDCILEEGPYPYEHGKLPFVPKTDIDVYGELWGRSFLTNIEQMQRTYNNVQSGIARDFSIGAAPKWVTAKGSCDVTNFNNEFTIMEFTGPTAPQLVTSRATTPQNFQFQEMLEKRMSQSAAVYDISRGEVPSGVTANSALRFLDEQESQRLANEERKHKQFVLDVYKMNLELMRQFYTANDDRTARILGRGNEYLIKSLKKADFTRIYDVRLENTSALPDTKTGKISAIIDLNAATQTDPIFRKKEVIELLDLGNDEQFKDRASVATTAARTALQRILEGEEVPEPKPWDDFLIHYNVFTQELQSTEFKSRVTPEILEQLVKYIFTLEGLMFDRAGKNQKFLMEMLELDNYPMFFEPDTTLTQLLQASMAAGQPPMPPQTGGIDTTQIKDPIAEGQKE